MEINRDREKGETDRAYAAQKTKREMCGWTKVGEEQGFERDIMRKRVLFLL